MKAYRQRLLGLNNLVQTTNTAIRGIGSRHMQTVFFSGRFQFKRVLLLCFVCLVAALPTSTVVAQMPGLNQAKLVTPQFTNEPIEVGGGQICLDRSQRYLAISPNGYSSKVVRIIDLQNGQEVKTFEIKGKVVSLRADLKQVLVQARRGNGVKLVSIAGKSPREVRELKKDNYHRGSGRVYYFASSDRIVTHGTADKVGFSVLDTTQGRLIYQPVAKQRYSDRKFKNYPTITPDGQFIVFQQSKATQDPTKKSENLRAGSLLKFIAVDSGSYAGHLQLDAEDEECQSVRISPDGKRVIGVRKEKTVGTVSGFATSDGSRQFSIRYPLAQKLGPRQKIRWLGNDHFLIGNLLISYSQKKILARLEGFAPEHIVESTGQAFFRDRYDGKYYLTVENVLDKLQPSLKTVKSTATSLLKPGDSVSVVYELPDKAPISEYEDKFEYAVYKSLTDSGFQLQKNAKTKLTIVVDERGTGKTILIAMGIENTKLPANVGRIKIDRFSEQKRFTIPEVKMECRWSLSGPDGVAVVKGGFNTGVQNEFEYSDRDELLESTRRWRWLKLLEGFEGQFESEYIDFDLSTITFKSGPSESWLADKRTMRFDTERLERKPKDLLDRKARDQKRIADRKASARRYFERAKSNSGSTILNDSQSLLDWNFKPPEVSQLNSQIGQRPILLNTKRTSRIRDVRFSSSKKPQAAVAISESTSKATEGRVDRYDLVKRKQLASTPVARSSKFYDFRPDGKVWMVSKGSDFKTIQIFQVGRESTDKMVAELDLSANKEDSIENAWFIGVKTILTSNRSEIAGYELPSGKQIFQFSDGAWLSKYREYQPVLSDDRRYFVCRSDRGLDVRLTADGSIACELKLSSFKKNVGGMAFSTDSKRLAVATSQGIEIFDMETGKPLQQVCIARLPVKIDWLSSDLLLCGDKVISLTTGEIVWQYSHAHRVPFLSGLPSTGWVLGQNGKGQKSLLRHSIPEPSVVKRIQAFEKMQPRILSAGDEVDIEVVGKGENLEGLEVDLVSKLKASLQAAGYKIQAGSPAKIVIEIDSPKIRRSGKIFMEKDENFIRTSDFNYRGQLRLESKGHKRTIRSIQFSTLGLDYAVDWSVDNPKTEFEQNWKAELVRRIVEMPFPDHFLEPAQGPLGVTTFERTGEIVTPK